jgi:hypothetical protein
MTETNWHFDFSCGCIYDHNGGDTHCAEHTWKGEPSVDSPATALRWRNIVDEESYARWLAKQAA